MRRLILVSALVAAAPPAGADIGDRVQRTVPLPPGATIVVEASNAVVRIVGSARDDLGIHVERVAPTAADLATFPVVIDADDRRVRLAVRQPGTDARLRATIRLDVPMRAHVEAVRVDEGGLDVTDFSGTLGADLRRGAIAATRVGGVLRLETGIGDIDVRQARLDPAGLIRLRTFNGDVRLALDETPQDARLMALALNGTITSAIPLTTKTAWGPRWGEATLGRGEPVVSIDVVTGDIRITAGARRR